MIAQGAQSLPIEPARVEWREGKPYTPDFADIYFAADAAAETQRVFIAPSNLDEQPQQSLYTVGELGFGTGLNFFTTAAHLLARASVRLHFISIEAHPLALHDHHGIAAHLHSDTARALHAEWQRSPPPLLGGWHRRVLAAGRVTLSMFHGTAADALADLVTRQHQPVDAWFLDGFAPDRNPAMWQPELFASMARLSRSGTSVTTFTAVGQVRRDLQQAGFEMRRVDQRPHKRESLAGRFTGPVRKPGFTPPSQVQVIGGGIAAAACARHLAEQNIEVALIAPHGLADGASQIAHAVCHARLLGDGSANADLRVQSFHYTLAYLAQAIDWQGHGALQIQGPTMDAAKLARIASAYQASSASGHWIETCDEAQAVDYSGYRPPGTSLWFPEAGRLDLAASTHALAAHANVSIQATPLARDLPTVLCTGIGALAFAGCEHLEIREVHGQLDHYQHAHPFVAPIVGNGYLVPGNNILTLGSTYEYTPWSEGHAREHNLAANAHLLDPSTLPATVVSTKAARAISSDRLPIIGKLGDTWLNVAHGSMGATSAPLGAALVMSQLLGWIAPLNHPAQTLVEPGRFAQRQARRGARHLPAPDAG